MAVSASNSGLILSLPALNLVTTEDNSYETTDNREVDPGFLDVTSNNLRDLWHWVLTIMTTCRKVTIYCRIWVLDVGDDSNDAYPTGECRIGDYGSPLADRPYDGSPNTRAALP